MTVGGSVESQQANTGPMKTTDGLRIRLIGELRVERGSAAIELPPSKRTRALLGFLVATAAPQSRQALCDLLWDGPDDPRAALRWSLSKLRPLIDDPGIPRLKADREHVSFLLAGAGCDIERVGELLRGDPAAAGTAEIEEAAGHLQGEFLDGLDLPSCYRFHHWCLAERERWGALRRQVLSLAVERLSDEPDRALPHARALVAADPLSEAAHGRLVALLAALGRRKLAQEHYAYARDLLQRELRAPLVGQLKPPASPSANRARSGPPEVDVEAGAVACAPEAVRNVGEARLFGRTGERETISALLQALVAGTTPKAMLLTGEPGIGKSRLLDFAADAAEAKGARVARARCFEAEAVRPFGCWADLLGPLAGRGVDQSVRRDLAQLLPSGEPPTDGEGSRNRLFAAVMAVLTSVAAERPLIVMIDDLQWIDEASSSLLHYILRASDRPARFLFVGAARADEIEDNPWCKRLVAALAQDGAVRRFKLEPLADAEAALFFGARADRDEVTAALKQCGGNPLFLKELANASRPSGDGSAAGIDSLIADRIARLDQPERELIVFASVTTRDFEPELLAAAMDVPETQLLGRIERLERRGLLQPSGDGRFDFAHDLIRQTTYRGLSQPRRRLVHRQIARVLDGAAQRDPALAGELAFHAGAAGDHALAVRASIAAGEQCLRMFANTAAEDAADRGLGHLQQLPIGPDRAHSHIALLSVKVFANAGPGARPKAKPIDELRQAIEAAELMGLREDAALGWHLISWTDQHLNDTASTLRAILRSEEISRPTDESTRCWFVANAARCLMEVEGDVRRARGFMDDAEQIAARIGKNFVELYWGRGLIARWDGDLTTAEECMRRALALARLRQDRWRELECLVWLVKIAIERDQPSEVGRFCDEIDVVAARIGDGPAPVADALRVLALVMEENNAAEHQLPEKLDALRAFDDKAQLAYVLNHLADYRLRCGRAEEARAAATEALGVARAVNRTTEIIVAEAILADIAAKSRRSSKDNQPIAVGGKDVAMLSARARGYLQRASNIGENPTVAQTPTD